MDTLAELTTASRRKPGRLYIGLGIVAALLGPVLYVLQVQAKHLTVPWYAPILGTIGAGLMLLALVKARTVWRIIGLLLLGLFACCEWYFLLSVSKLPAYTGPVSADRAFPAFATSLADGTAFDQDSLKGEQNTAMVFFRGRW